MNRLIARIIDALRRLAGRRSSKTESTSIPTTEHRCTICKTVVSDPDEGCPLCGSTLLADDGAAEAAGSQLDPTNVRRATVKDDDSAEKLSELRRAPTDLLVQYADRWEELETASGQPSAYRIHLPDGGSERVQTKDALRAALLNAYGLPVPDTDSTESSESPEA